MEVVSLTIIVAIALGTGWLASGIKTLRRSTFAVTPLFIALVVTYLVIVRGFYLHQDLRSSKNLVNQANNCLGSDPLWVFEGSREIGAAGAVSFYLNQNAIASVSDTTPELAPKSANTYRTVMVLADGGKNRIPPKFPGDTPQYLITKAQLQDYWNSDRPVVFLTDFLRQPNDSNDLHTLNLPEGAVEPYLINGQRRLYLNQAATRLVNRQCIQHVSD